MRRVSRQGQRKKPHRPNDEAHRATKCCCSVQTNGNRTGLRFQPTDPPATSLVVFCYPKRPFKIPIPYQTGMRSGEM